MIFEVDFESEEALYIQLRNQILMGIATAELQEGSSLPSVRDMADLIGINMHTVNKAYAVLRQDGFLRLDRRRGAVICIDPDKLKALAQTEAQLQVILARAICSRITRSEIHALVDQIMDEYEGF